MCFSERGHELCQVGVGEDPSIWQQSSISFPNSICTLLVLLLVVV